MDPSLWSRYIQEIRSGRTSFIEKEWGFVSYSLPEGDSVFVEDIYIVPDFRDAAHAYALLGEVEQAGRKAGKSHSIFVVACASASAATNLRVYLAMGFVPVAADSGNIWLKRAFKEGE